MARYKTKYVLNKHRKYARPQRGGFLNRYDFVYAGRDTVNQAMKGLEALAKDNQSSFETSELCC